MPFLKKIAHILSPSEFHCSDGDTPRRSTHLNYIKVRECLAFKASVLSINPDATQGGVRFILLQPVHDRVTVHGTFFTFFSEFESFLYMHNIFSALSTAGDFFVSLSFLYSWRSSLSVIFNLLPPPLAPSSCVYCPPFVSSVAVGSSQWVQGQSGWDNESWLLEGRPEPVLLQSPLLTALRHCSRIYNFLLLTVWRMPAGHVTATSQTKYEFL